MKFSDFVAICYLLAIVAFLVFCQETFIRLTTEHPYFMGFAKVGLLATFGECLKNRIKQNRWLVSKMLWRFAVWGLFGIWFAAAFPFTAYGLKGLVSNSLWISGGKWWMAFSTSLWINFLGGYALTMMITHEYFNHAIANGQIISFRSFADCMSGRAESMTWFKFIPLTIFIFWIPAHTITFALPEYYRVLFAACLSIFLGFLITIIKKK